MRWPWEWVPWGRGRGAKTAGSDAGDTEDRLPGRAHLPAAAEPRSATLAAWASLPPLQRHVAEATAVAPPEAFRSSLTSHQNPSFLAPLGHLVDADGPSGVIGGLTSPVGQPIPYDGAVELPVPDRPAAKTKPAVQRQIATLRPEPGDPPERRGQDAPAEPSTSQPETVQPETVQPETVQPETVQPETVQPETIQSGPVQSGPVQSGPVQSETAQSETVQRETIQPDSPATTFAADSGLVVARQPDGSGPAPSAGWNVPGTASSDAASVLTPVPQQSPAPGVAGIPVQRSSAAAEVAPTTPTVGATEPKIAAAGFPLLVPVQRAAVQRSAKRDSAGPAAVGSADDRSEPGTSAAALDAIAPGPPVPAPRDELVVAQNSGSDPAAPAPEQPAAAELADLLADRPLLVEPPQKQAPALQTAEPGAAGSPLPVPGKEQAQPPSPAPMLQRQFTERPGPGPVPGPEPTLPTIRTPVSLPPTAPPPTLAAATSTPVDKLDADGYPPLVARSVQRRTVDAAPAGRSQTTTPPGPSASDAADRPPTSEAPLSGFTAAISALQDLPETNPGPPADAGGGDPAPSSAGSIHGIDLVVARRVDPDGSGRLPAADVRLRPTPSPGPPAPVVQRDLVAHRPALVRPGTAPAEIITAVGTPSSPGPQVQRLHYSDTVSSPRGASPGGASPVGGLTAAGDGGAVIDAAAEPPAQLTAESALPGQPSGAAPPSLGPPSFDRPSFEPRGFDRPGFEPPGFEPPGFDRPGVATSPSVVPPAAVQRMTGPPAGDRPAGRTALRLVEDAPPSAVSPAAAFDINAPLIQRRFDAGAPGVEAAPVRSSGTASVAVSSRTVGLAEMFALAAAQSSAGEPAVQRSLDTEVQLASSEASAAPAVTESSTATGPATPAATSAGPPSGAELEEMARRLYEPLSARIRAELWQDRERAGLLTDLRP